MSVLVVIVNYGTAVLTVECLASIEAEIAAIPGARVTVVDNASPDDSVDVLSQAIMERGWNSWVTVCRADRNGGFSYGNNLAIRAALKEDHPPEFVLLLNPDTLAREQAIRSLIEFMQANPKVGIAGSRLEDRDGTPQPSAFRFHSILGELEHAARFGLLSKVLSHWIVARPIPTASIRTDWVSGASFMIRRSVLDAVGLLDEKYFMYFEETDLCLRAARAGWETRYVPVSRVVHLVSQATDGRRISNTWEDSRQRYFKKNHGRIYATLANLFRGIGRALWRGRKVLHLTHPDSKAVVQNPTVTPVHAVASQNSAAPEIGVVIIGRNEGDRLIRCLDSVSGSSVPIVYVDSGSSDGSIATARERGGTVVELDTSTSFTAARARNAGWRRLLALHPHTQFVQFIDGDCEMNRHWLSEAARYLRDHCQVAAVCGRLRERHPEASIYNRLCDIEWSGLPGQVDSCGGVAMYRAQALADTGGFNPDLIAGEEPDLCLRLREKRWTIQRLDTEMALHDAAMTRFSQWWRRSLRSGHAQAQGASLHGHLAARPWVRECRRVWFWAALLPILALGGAVFTHGWSLLLLTLYAALLVKVFLHAWRRQHLCARDAGFYAGACVLMKFPQLFGQLKFSVLRLQGRRSEIIEYKPVRST